MSEQFVLKESKKGRCQFHADSEYPRDWSWVQSEKGWIKTPAHFLFWNSRCLDVAKPTTYQLKGEGNILK